MKGITTKLASPRLFGMQSFRNAWQRLSVALMLVMLTTMTAWANDAVTYIDMDGKTKTVTEYTEVTTDMPANGYGLIYWSSGTYVVKSSVTLNSCIRYGGEVIDLIVCDGATLTVNGTSDGAFDGSTLNIYAQSNGTGMGVVNVKKHTKCNQLNIAGGKVTLDDDGVGYGLYVFSGDACGLTVNGGDVTIQNNNGNQGAIFFDGNGFVTLNGGKLTVTNSYETNNTAITGNSYSKTINFNGGTAVINGRISNFNNINLNSGNVTVNGEIYKYSGYTVTYDFTHATDSYCIQSFSNDLNVGRSRTVQVKDGVTFLCDGNKYIGPLTLTDDDIAAISDQTMTPDVSNHFSVNDAGTEYTIHTTEGWNVFCDLLADNTKGYFDGKTVNLGADITVTRMAGGDSHEFTGTFDGGGHTLTVSISSSDSNAAPFREIMGATIRNLKVSGSVSGHKHSAGLVSYARGADSSVENTIENCLVDVDVSTIVNTDGDCYLGGIVGHGFNCKLTIRGCAFTGSLTSPHNYTGGLQGWSDGNTLILENDLFAASSVNAANVGFHPIAIHANNKTTTATVTNVYYTVAPTCTTASRIAAAGKQAHTVTAGTDVTVAHAGVATHYATSGITAYKATGASADTDPFIAGLLYNNVVDVLYAGSDEVVSLTLSNTATGAPDGYQYGYTTNAGTLEGSTLTMPAADVTISVNTDVLVAIDWANEGRSGDSATDAYMIYNKDQLDLLAYRVNGTHGETCRDDGYENKFFQLAKDISYSHTSDWDAFDSDESNYEAIGGYYGGNRYFRGHFDGNNNTISGIRIYKDGTGNANRFQGIFGLTGSGADIHDLTLANARITGYDYTGGIVGYNVGATVTHCHVAGDVAVCAVKSDAYGHGGIVGNNYDGTIEQCTSAANLTIADATSAYYGGIAGINYGTLSDNLAIGATVPAAKDNSYGAITGYDGGSLLRNYYAACKVADTENATGVGCNNADVTANNGAVSIHTLTLADGITTSTAATVTIGTTGYYAQGTTIALSYSGTTGDAPQGYQYGYTVSAGTISGSTLTMPDQDVTVSFGLRSTHEAVEVSYVDADGNTQTAQAIALDGTESDLVSYGPETWYFVGLPTVAFDHTLYLYGDVNLILADGCTMNVTGSNGIVVNDGSSLTIYGQTDGTGTLNATGFFDGIIADNGGDIIINGGTVTATGDEGIHSDSGDITISGGTVTATGRSTGIYIIGSGTITISGGTVTATSDYYGISTNSGDITISGGRVTVTGGVGITTNSSTITLGSTTDTDFIYASSYFVGSGGRLNIAGGQTLYDEDDNSYSGTLTYPYPVGKTLRPLRNVLALYDSEDNSEAISDNNGQQRNVVLYDRTLYKDGAWNTLCLPFDVELAGSPLEGAEAKTVIGATTSGNDLTINFGNPDSETEPVTVLKAGVPYIIKWEATNTNIVEPVFTGVTIDNSAAAIARKTVSVLDGDVKFVGYYDALSLDPAGSDDFAANVVPSIYYMTADNTLKHTGVARTLHACRAYFQFDETDPNVGQSRVIRLNFGEDETTEILSTTNFTNYTNEAGAWYTVDGVKLNGKPTRKGLYIFNGKVVVIK